MKVTVNPYHRSVTIDGEEIVQKITEFPNSLNNLATINCVYDATTKTVTEVSDIHRYTSYFVEREYYFQHLPEFVEWFYAEKQAQADELIRMEDYKTSVENAINLTVQAGETAQAAINVDKETALTAITTTKTEALETISRDVTTGLNSINSGRTSALSQIADERNSNIAALNQVRTETTRTITEVKDTTLASIAQKEQEIDSLLEAKKTSAIQAINTTGQTNQATLNDLGQSYLNQSQEKVSQAQAQADRAEDAADRAESIADLHPATRTSLGLVKIGRGLSVDAEGLVEVRSSITMLAPIVEAPDVLPLGYNSVFTMQAYPGLGQTNIKQYRCTLEGVGQQIVEADTTGKASVTFVVPRATGVDVSRKLTVIAIDTLDNESLPTEVTRNTATAYVNPPSILTPETDSDIYPLAGFTATASEFKTTALADTHASTDWIIAKDSKANTIVVEVHSTIDLINHTFTREELRNKVFPNQTYYVFARFNGTILGASALNTTNGFKGVKSKPDSINAPIISTPQELDIVYPAAGFIAEISSEFITVGTADTHTSTDWYISSDRAGTEMLVSILKSSDLKTHKFTPTELKGLPEGVYYVLARFNGESIGAGKISDGRGIVAKLAYITAPDLTQENMGSVYPTGGITLETSSVFQSSGITDDTHKNTDWFIFLHEDGTGIIASAMQSADLYSHTFAPNQLTNMEIGKVYYVGCRFNGEKIETGRLSPLIPVVAKGAYIVAPVIRTPVDGADIYKAAGFTISTDSEFTVIGTTDSHVSSDYIISNDVDGLDVVISAMGSTDLKSHTFSPQDLEALVIDNQYYLHMRFNGTAIPKGTTSNAVVRVHAKPAAIVAPVINSPIEGSNCYRLGGLYVSTDSVFETIGIASDIHVTSDWIIAKDRLCTNILAQVLNSTDLINHTFSPTDLASMIDNTEYFVFCRFNGSIIPKGLLSEPIKVIARPASIKAPVLNGVDNSPCYYKAGIIVTTDSLFEPIGITDTHKSTDWIFASDITGQNVIAEALNSSDLKSHTFTAENLGTLNNEQTYYILCRFNGNTVLKGTLSNALRVVAKPAYLNKPVISSVTDPCYLKTGDVTLTLAPVSAVGVTANRTNSEWKICTDSAGTNVLDSKIQLDNPTFNLSSKINSLTHNQTLYAFVRWQDAMLGWSNWSDGKPFVASQLTVNKPSITSPTANAQINTDNGLTLVSSAFSCTNGTDTHSASDWAVSSDANRNNLTVSASNSSDKTSHTFTGLSLTDKTTYYAHVRHKGQLSGYSEWSNGVPFVTDLWKSTPSGRKIRLHYSSEFIELLFNYWGTNKIMRIPVAKHRTTAVWRTNTSTDISNMTNIQYNGYPCGSQNNNAPFANPAQFTDAFLQEKFRAANSLFASDKTGRQNTDILVGYSDAAAAKYCRNLNIAGLGVNYFDLPNPYELFVCYVEGDSIDAIDPTANSYTAYKLGYTNSGGYRFGFNGNNVAWTSTEYSSSHALYVYNGGHVHYDGKHYYYGVCPCRVIDV